MRLLLALLFSISPLLAGEATLADRCPKGATAYVEVRDLAGKVDALLASPLGEAVRAHPAYAEFQSSPELAKFQMGEAFLKGATGKDLRGVLRVLASGRVGVAVYGAPPRVLALAEVDAAAVEPLLRGAELLTKQTRETIFPADDGRAALWRLGPAFLVLDGGILCVTPVQELAAAFRNRAAGGVPGFARAREVGPRADLAGWVDMKVYGAPVRATGKPKDIGQAFLLGALAHHAPRADWAAFALDLVAEGDAWRLRARAAVPADPEAPAAVRESFGGTLEDLPLRLPANTLALMRMRRSLPKMWTHREELIAERGIPGLVEFETNFGNLTGGMSWVEQFLPSLRDEDLAVVVTRRRYAKGEAVPEVRFPQGAILFPVKKSDAFATRMQIAFQTAIGIINAQQGMMGRPFLIHNERYKDTLIQVARYVPPSEGEMEGRKNLPVHYNLEPSAAMVGDTFVFASTSAALKEVIDAQGGATPVPAGVNGGIWLRPSEIRAILRENRSALVAQTMMKEGIGLDEAGRRIDLMLDLGRFVRDASLVVEESRATQRLVLDVVVGPGKE